jgi:hypothetical protein
VRARLSCAWFGWQDWQRKAEIERRLQRDQAAVIAELQAPFADSNVFVSLGLTVAFRGCCCWLQEQAENAAAAMAGHVEEKNEALVRHIAPRLRAVTHCSLRCSCHLRTRRAGQPGQGAAAAC